MDNSKRQAYHSWYIDIIKHTEIIKKLKEQRTELKQKDYDKLTETDLDLQTQIDFEIIKYEESKMNIYKEGSRKPIPVLSNWLIYAYIWARDLDKNNLNPVNISDIV